MHNRILIALIAPFLLSGCLAQSEIQGQYMDSQEHCRNETARSVMGGETARPVSENQASPIAQRFSDCMTKQGWHLATPKPGSAVASNNPPTGSPSTNPSAALGVSSYPATVTGPPASAYPPASSYPVYRPVAASAAVSTAAPVASTAVTRAAPVAASAPTVAPSNVPAPSRAVAAPNSAPASAASVPNVPTQTSIPSSPDVATYQPGRPAGEAAPFYGTGPGRQF